MHHASHNYLANTEKKTHIMSCHIRHACDTSHSRKTPKVQNSSSKFKIMCCRMRPESNVTAASHSVSALDLPLDLIAFQEHLLPALGVWSFRCLYKQRFPPCRYVYKT